MTTIHAASVVTFRLVSVSACQASSVRNVMLARTVGFLCRIVDVTVVISAIMHCSM